MTIIYYQNNGKRRYFTKFTLDECLQEYYGKRRKSAEGANWGHYIDDMGERHYI